jgi:hypothetical protein
MSMTPRVRQASVVSLVAVLVFAGTAGLAHGGPFASWDRRVARDQRFRLLEKWNNEVVLDRETGLVWQRTPATAIGWVWDQGVPTCASLTVGDRKGWRLPAVHELMSLVDDGSEGVSSEPPFTGIRDRFWLRFICVRGPGATGP